MKNLIIALVIIIAAQLLAYLQTQSQFFWTWAKEHPLLMSITGIPISYEDGYDYHIPGCEISKDTFKGEEEGNCPHWIYEYLDKEREEKLNDLGI